MNNNRLHVSDDTPYIPIELVQLPLCRALLASQLVWSIWRTNNAEMHTRPHSFSIVNVLSQSSTFTHHMATVLLFPGTIVQEPLVANSTF